MLIKPQSLAVSGLINLPVYNNSAAFEKPIIFGNNQAPPSPGIKPIFKNVTPKSALSDAMRISAKQATSFPKPIAGPLIAAITGTSIFQTARIILCIPYRYLSLNATVEPEKLPFFSFIFLTLPPAENEEPSPVKMTHLISLSLLITSRASSKFSASSGSQRGFLISGLFKLKIAIELFFLNFNHSFIVNYSAAEYFFK